MLVQATALTLIAIVGTFPAWAIATALLGAGTAMVYPTLLAAIGDVAHPGWRARSVGVYRFWRDSGYVACAVLGGIVADIYFGNPSGTHHYGRSAHDAVNTARSALARPLEATPEEIVFTGSRPEASTLAIRGAALARRDFGNHIIT